MKLARPTGYPDGGTWPNFTGNSTYRELARGIDSNSETDSTAAKERRMPDQEKADKLNRFCRQLMANGLCADARIWVQAQDHTLGEMDHEASRQLVERLTQVGAVQIFACEIDDYGEQGQNTGHLVVELSKEKASRSKLLEVVARLAEKLGFEGDPDDGQDYIYIKLD